MLMVVGLVVRGRARLGRGLAAAIVACQLAAITACSVDRDAKKHQLLAAGDSFVAQKQFKEALLEYRNAVQLDPMFGEARVKLAAAYEQVGDGTNALREYVRAADLFPNDVALQLKAGGYLIASGQVDDALSRADVVLKQQPGNIEAHILRGNALGGLNNFDEALKEMEEALRLDPNSGAAYTQLGLVESARGRQVEAEAAFRRAIELAPSSVAGRLALANFYWAAGRFNDAGQALETSLQMSPNDESANHAMAIFSLATGRVREAERYLKQLASTTRTPGAQFTLADYYIATHRSAEAISILTPIASAPKPPPEAKHRLARAYIGAGLADEAQEIISGLLAQTPGDAEAHLLKGQLALQENRPEEAVASVKAAVAAEPQSVEAQFVLGRVYAARGDYAGAEAAFREVLKINPSATAAQTELSVLQLATGAASAALLNAEAAVKSQPERLETRLALVRGLLAARQLDRAQQELQPLLATHSHLATVLVQSAVLAASRNDVQGARATFEKALSIEANSIEALGGLLALDLNAKNYDAARRRVTTQLESSAVTPALLLLAARTYGSAGDLPAAEKALRRAIQADPTLLPAYSMLGQIYLAQGKLDQALQEFDSLAKHQSSPVGALTMSGMIQQALKNPSQARARYERAVTLDPRAAVAANNLAWMYSESGEKLDDAVRLARNAAEVLPDAPEVLDTLGWAYYKNGLADVAVGPLVRSVQQDPKNGGYRFHLGLAYLKAGDPARAREALVEALKLSPSASWAAEARWAIAEIAQKS
jgi:tetratricopeptide (TPR) repeat protein